jgi:hypothetical protein
VVIDRHIRTPKRSGKGDRLMISSTWPSALGLGLERATN